MIKTTQLGQGRRGFSMLRVEYILFFPLKSSISLGYDTDNSSAPL